jgi:hypothetical protein
VAQTPGFDFIIGIVGSPAAWSTATHMQLRDGQNLIGKERAHP